MPREFRDFPDPIIKFEQLFYAALESLLQDLASAPWYIREHEVVNMFVFHHLVIQFQNEDLEVGQIGIEVPARQHLDARGKRPAVYADLVVWPHSRATLWRGCKPLARIEWKNISCREKCSRVLEKSHEDDIEYLKQNSQFFQIGYAVLTDQRDYQCAIRCQRIWDGKAEEFLPLQCKTTCAEDILAELGRCKEYLEFAQMPQDCLYCTLPTHSQTGRTVKRGSVSAAV